MSATELTRLAFHQRCGCLRDEDPCGSRASLPDGIGYVLEDGQVEMCAASLLRVCATDDLCAWEYRLISLLLSSAVPFLAQCQALMDVYRMRWLAQREICCSSRGLACGTLSEYFHAGLGFGQEVCEPCDQAR
jgi:hypothetical protein